MNRIRFTCTSRDLNCPCATHDAWRAAAARVCAPPHEEVARQRELVGLTPEPMFCDQCGRETSWRTNEFATKAGELICSTCNRKNAVLFQ